MSPDRQQRDADPSHTRRGLGAADRGGSHGKKSDVWRVGLRRRPLMLRNVALSSKRCTVELKAMERTPCTCQVENGSVAERKLVPD